jgi:hypothetical protein
MREIRAERWSRETATKRKNDNEAGQFRRRLVE